MWSWCGNSLMTGFAIYCLVSRVRPLLLRLLHTNLILSQKDECSQTQLTTCSPSLIYPRAIHILVTKIITVSPDTQQSPCYGRRLSPMSLSLPFSALPWHANAFRSKRFLKSPRKEKEKMKYGEQMKWTKKRVRRKKRKRKKQYIIILQAFPSTSAPETY